MIDQLRTDLKKAANPKKAKLLQGFFKTGKGEYGEGDIFLGITVPQLRKIALKFKNLSFAEIKTLLKSKIHEERLIALLILVSNFEKGLSQKKNYKFYLACTKYINNWDLVDLSASRIVGRFLFENPGLKPILYKLARSQNLWERRIAIISTLYFIVKGEFKETFKIAEILLNDRHDLIQKAVGWMLREVGMKCSVSAEKEFLSKHYKQMPRTMLRYAIERFPEEDREKYLKGRI